LDGWGELIPKELFSYIRTTTFRLNSLRFKKDRKIGNAFCDFIEDNSFFDLEDMLLQEQLNLIAEETLTEREKQIIDLTYRENLTEVEIARRLKISQPMVSRHHSKALQKLRKNRNIRSIL
jgi:RNA polymerase sigma factor (sigma-70 family)